MGDGDLPTAETSSSSPHRDPFFTRWVAVSDAVFLGPLVHLLLLQVLNGVATQWVGLNVETPFSRLLLLPLPSFAEAVLSIGVGTALAPGYKRQTANLLTGVVSLVALGRLGVALMSEQYIMIVRSAFMFFRVYTTREFLREFLLAEELTGAVS